MQENSCGREFFLINLVGGLQLKPIFIQKGVPALVFSWQLSKIFNNNFFKEHCFKKKNIFIRNVDRISTANLITELFYLTRARFLYFETVHSDDQGRSHWGKDEGGEGMCSRAMPPLQFPNQTRSTSFSFKHQGFCFLLALRNYTDRKLHHFYCVCYNFWTIYGGFSFFLIT